MDGFVKFLVLIVCIIHVSGQKQDVCRVVAFGMGGDRGAYEAGVLKGLLDIVPDEIQWNVVSGISIGAANAGFLSQFKIGNEAEAVAFILERWLDIKKTDLYVGWPGGIADGLLYHSGIYNNTIGREYYEKQVNTTKVRSSGRKLRIGAANLADATFQVFTEDHEDVARCIAASCSIPGLFDFVRIDDGVFVDGGTFTSTLITDALKLCYEISDNVVADIIMAENNVVPPSELMKYKVLEVLWRVVEYSRKMSYDRDLQMAQEIFPKATFHIYAPSAKLPGGEDFNHDDIIHMIDLGYNDAHRIRKMNEED